ncbi:hypothetical protein LIER_35376 [Lithospermum erythrorhizon]|uniref:Endonuclease/exonuclease/phosphatase domain-containing protein n=1 Tax=Lithospermum erythrorhizon TaxID=34254 RepID=A0AAV3NR51_LITER
MAIIGGSGQAMGHYCLPHIRGVVYEIFSNSVWNPIFDVVVLEDGRQHVHIRLTHVQSAVVSYLRVVYASTKVKERRELWKALYAIAQNATPWMVMGDFNTISAKSEQIGHKTFDPVASQEFNDCINACKLEDACFIGSGFTWTNCTASTRLDKVLYDSRCVTLLPALSVTLGQDIIRSLTFSSKCQQTSRETKGIFLVPQHVVKA